MLWFVRVSPACSHRLSASTPCMYGCISGNEAISAHAGVKEKKATEEKQKLVDTCVAHSFLHLYLLIRKNKSNRFVNASIQGDTGREINRSFTLKISSCTAATSLWRNAIIGWSEWGREEWRRKQGGEKIWKGRVIKAEWRDEDCSEKSGLCEFQQGFPFKAKKTHTRLHIQSGDYES